VLHVAWDAFGLSLALQIFAGQPVVAATNQLLSTGTTVVPKNERWEVSLVSMTITVDDATLILLANSAYMRIFTSNVNQVPNTEMDVPLSLAVVDPTNLTIKVSSLLSGLVLGQGDSIIGRLHITNTDAVNTHNVTGGTFAFRYVPYRLVSEIGIANLVPMRADSNLDARLRGR